MNYKKLAANSTETSPKKHGPGRPWPKGVSGNPSGRPKSKPVTELFKKIFDDPEAAEEIRANILATLKTKGMAGVILLGHVADRLEGKTPDELTITDLRELSDEELAARLEKIKNASS